MKLYYIKNDYILFLRKYDSKVPDNKRESRPYVGVVVEIENIKYYAPLTSPKVKHQKMKNGIDFRKIAGGQYGAINFNNMIPVPDTAIHIINIDNEPDYKYRRLLREQIKAIQNDEAAIKNTAFKLRELLLKDEKDIGNHDKLVKERCCNLSLLESVYDKFDNI